MEFLWKTDWARVFVPEMSLLEIVVRGTLIFVTVCLLLRVVLKRQTGGVATSDLLVAGIVGGVCRNPLVRDAYSVTDGLLVVGVVLSWSYALDWLSYHSRLVHRLLHRPPSRLVEDGRVLHERLRHELMTEGQLKSQLRSEGVRDVAEVEGAWLEDCGKVSVLKRPRPALHRPADGAGQPGQPPAAEALQAAARALEEVAERHRQALAEGQRDLDEIRQVLRQLGVRAEEPPAAEANGTGRFVST